MARYSIDDKTIASIATAIREKTGSTEAMPVNDMAEEIASIEVGGEGHDLIKFTVNYTSDANSIQYDYLAYAGMSWEIFCNSMFNLNEVFLYAGADPDTRFQYMQWQPLGKASDICLIKKDSSGTFISDPIIQDGMIVYALGLTKEN